MLIVYLLRSIHVMVCAVLIIVVLLQHGKSADIAATFGGVGSQTAFGPRGTATLLSRVTTWCAVLFMITSISLSVFVTKRQSNSVMEKIKATSSATPQKSPK